MGQGAKQVALNSLRGARRASASVLKRNKSDAQIKARKLRKIFDDQYGDGVMRYMAATVLASAMGDGVFLEALREAASDYGLLARSVDDWADLDVARQAGLTSGAVVELAGKLRFYAAEHLAARGVLLEVIEDVAEQPSSILEYEKAARAADDQTLLMVVEVVAGQDRDLQRLLQAARGE